MTLTQQLDILGVPLEVEENQASKNYILTINPEDFTYTQARRSTGRRRGKVVKEEGRKEGLVG